MPDWEQHYLTRDVGEQNPASILMEHAYLLPESGKVLDYACGLAANGFWLAYQGFDVTAWDSSNIAVSKINQYSKQCSISIQAEVRDLENNPPTQAEFDVVIVDLTVPGGMGGKEAIGHLKKLDPKIKALVSSGYTKKPLLPT